uniref:TMEM127 domain-containing protein n=1 Tax=Strongyloides venezuelensis TaxID=75913 RepID=A0A0K0FBU0_STRVS
MLRLDDYTWKWKKSNVTAAVCNIVIALLMIVAIRSDEWFLIKKRPININEIGNNDTLLSLLKNVDKINEIDTLKLSTFVCKKVGAKNFWKKLKFGELIDGDNITHITTFFSPNQVAVDCITPVTASIFYSCIALIFAIIFLSIVNSFIYLLYPNNGFIGWLVQNSILDMCTITLLIFTLLIATCAKEDIQSIHNESPINDGPGFYLFVIAVFIGVFSIILAFKKSWNQRQRQRENNQRLMSACTLRSLRDIVIRPQTGHSADHYERYLLSREEENITTTTNTLITCNEDHE